MRFGVFLPPSGRAATPEYLEQLTRAAEDGGLDTVWIGDHVVKPVEYQSVYPYGSRRAFDVAHNFRDSLTLLGFLAGRTRRVGLGTAILIVPLRQPVLTAKIITTVDEMSGGRLKLGVGSGWLREEFEALGLDYFEHRGAVLDEFLDVYRRLWTEETTSFDGKFVQFKELRFEPKPAQPGGPPLIIGGHTPPAIRRAGRLGDGWMPFAIGPEKVSEALGKIDELRSASQRSGRPFQVIAGLQIEFADEPQSGAAWQLIGPPEHVLEGIRQYAEVGVTEVMMVHRPERFLEDVERLGESVVGKI